MSILKKWRNQTLFSLLDYVFSRKMMAKYRNSTYVSNLLFLARRDQVGVDLKKWRNQVLFHPVRLFSGKMVSKYLNPTYVRKPRFLARCGGCQSLKSGEIT